MSGKWMEKVMLAKNALMCAGLFLLLSCALNLGIARAEDIRLAVIPGAGPAQPPEMVSAYLEVELSNLKNITLVERRQIRQVLQEITLGAAGYQGAQQSAALGRLVNAHILVFVEKLVPDQAISGTDGADADVYRVRMVESRTGLVLEQIMTSFTSIPSGLEAVLPAVRAAIAKQQVDVAKRHYIGILDIKNNEPGTLLDGKAAALKMIVSMDLGRLPGVFVLERAHLQYLQTEKALTGMALQLKESAVLLSGGLQFERGQEKIKIFLQFRPMAQGRQPQRMEILVDKNDFEEARAAIQDAVLKMFESDMRAADQSGAYPSEGELFLRQVPLYLSSGDFQAAVNHAEAAYALLSTQDARYWAALAWYMLGWDLIQKSLPDSFRAGRITRSRVTSVGDQFTPGNTRVLKTRASVDAYPGGRAASSERENYPRKLSRVEQTGRVNPAAVSPPGNSNVVRQLKPQRGKSDQRPAGQYQPYQSREIIDETAPYEDASDTDRKVRYLSALIRSYSLTEALTYVHQREYASGQQKDIVLRNPQDHYNAVSSYQPQVRPMILSRLTRDEHVQVSALFEDLVLVQSKVNQLQRDFYFRHYADSFKAQECFWNAWKDKAVMIKTYWGIHPERSTKLLEQAIADYHRTALGDFSVRVRGVMAVLSVGTQQYFSDEEIAFFQRLSGHEDAFIRLMAHKQLLRVDPLKYSEKTIQLFVADFPYAHPFRQMEEAALVADFLKPAFHRLAISQQAKMLPLAKQLFAPIFRHQDMIQLVAYRDWLWPYIIGLEQSGAVKEAVDAVRQSIDILEKNGYARFSNQAKLLRAELDLKWVQLGRQKERNPALEQYFSLLELPAYIRLNPLVEPPRLNQPAIDVSVFQPFNLPTKGRHTTTTSKTSTVMTEQFSGDKFSNNYTRMVDVESNELYTMYNMDVQKEKTKRGGPWEDYSIRRVPVERVALQIEPMRGPRQDMPPLQKQMLLTQEHMFLFSQQRVNNTLVVQAFQHDLSAAAVSYHLGQVAVPLGHIKDYFPYYVSAIATGGGAVYAGTAGGLIVFPLNGRQPFSALGQTSKASRPQAKLITEKEGFPNDNILSLAYFQDKLYVGLGPLAENAMGLIGNCGFAAYDPVTGTYEIIASSRSEEKRNALEQGETYQITSILGDPQRNCLWLGIAGNPNFNGIWKYEVATGDMTPVIRENQGVRVMRWTGDQMVYFLNQSGLVRFDPESLRQTWLLAQAKSDQQTQAQPQPPRDYEGYPLYGAPKSRLWPFALEDERLFLIGWDQYDILIKEKGQAGRGRSVLNAGSRVAETKAVIGQNKQGIWIVTHYGNVYLVQRKN